METSAEDGEPGAERFLAIAARACFWRLRLIVV
jgi:hypothetical protein